MKLLTSSKNILVFALTILLTATMLLSPSVSSSADYTLKSNVWFEGTSSVRDWACKDVPADASLSLPETPESTQKLQALLQDVSETRFRTTVNFPVKKIRCEQGETMNGHMRDTLEAEEYPEITFELTSVKPGDTIDTTPLKFKADLTGDLTIKETTRSVEIPALVFVSDTGTIRVDGELPLDMTNYKVTPPTVMWTITVYDDITIHVDAALQQAE